MAEDSRPTWRVVTAAILDFVFIFFFAGYFIAMLTGSTTADGFHLTGGPALLCFAVIIAYFVIGKRVGGTLFKRLLGVVGP
jgi:hypothetical protein